MNKKNVERELIAIRKTGKNIKKANGITLLALVITIVLNCCRSGRNHIKETNLKNILEKRINLL